MVKPLKVILKCMEQHNMVVFPHTTQFDESKPKSNWYRENEYCAYHRMHDQDRNRCIKLKHLVQDLIDQEKLLSILSQENP